MFKKNLALCLLLACFVYSCKLREGDENTGSLDRLVSRIVPSLSGKVHFEIDSTFAGNNGESCRLHTKDGELYITANSKVAAAVGLNIYLKYYCHRSFSHTGDNLDSLPASLPPIEKDSMIIHSNYPYRYALNYCTINYTMSFWDWPEWERELDWMAMNGVNLMLAPIGTEKIWSTVLKDMGCSDSLAMSYAPGPAFTAWWQMGNLEGWQGPLSEEYVVNRVALQQKILARCRELGITPVVQGFYGMVPSFLKKQFPHARIIDQGKWEGGFTRSAFLQPGDPLFKKMADSYYREMGVLYGKDLRYFGGDPFHEGGKSTGIDVADAATHIYGAAAEQFDAPVWVLQGWQQNPSAEILKGFGNDHTLVLDLFGESDNSWEKRNGYEQHPWLWCMVNNFGEKTGLTGKLSLAVNEPLRAASSPSGKSMKGIGILPEGINNNAVLYDLLLEMAWHQQPLDLTKWIRGYSHYRYGVKDEHLENAWISLLRSVYSSPTHYNILGPVENVMLARPSLHVKSVSTWGNTALFYDTALVQKAAEEMLKVPAFYRQKPTFSNDMVDVFRQVISDRASTVYERMVDAYQNNRLKKFAENKATFLQLILQADSLCSLNKQFTLGNWLAQARALGKDSAEKRQFEKNALVQISYWGPNDARSSLIDYANKQWSGMLRSYYYDRWKIYLDTLGHCLQKGNHSNEEPSIDYFSMETKWAESGAGYSLEPQINDTLAFLQKIIKR